MYCVWRAVRVVAFNHLVDVWALMQCDAAVVVALDLYVEQVGHVAFVFGVPMFEEAFAEGCERGGVVVVQDHDVVDVAANDDGLIWGGAAVDEDAWIGVCACEALSSEPVEEISLEAPSSLNEAVQWFVELPGDASAL